MREKLVIHCQDATPRRYRSLLSRHALTAMAGLTLCFATSHAASAQAPVRRLNQPAPVTRTQGAAPQAGPQAMVVAEVNNERITRVELGNECLNRFGAKVLESIVNRQVIWQACQRRQIQVTDAEVDAEIESIAKRFGMDVGTWVTMLKNERDITHQQYRREIVWPMLALRKLARAELVVGEEEVEKALEAEYGPRIRARIISVGTYEKAQKLHAEAKANPNAFGDLAKQHSEDPNSASARGLIPPIRRHIGDPKVEASAFALNEGEISEVIHVANQYIIIKCDKRVPQTFLTPDQLTAARSRAVEQLRDQRLRSEANAIFQRLQAEAKVVNVFGNRELEAKHPGVAALINGRPLGIDQLVDECILRHGEETLEIEVNRRLLAQALQREGKTVTKADVESEIRRAADAYGYVKPNGEPDMQKWLETVSDNDQKQVDVYVSDAVWPSAALKKLVNERIEITQADLQEGYESSFGERVEVLAIMLNNRRDAQKVWDMARNNPSDEFFGELASQYSIEPVSKANYGKVPPIRRHSGQKNLEEEAFRLKPGELSGLISVKNNFIILHCLGRTKPMVKLEEVKDELTKDIHERKLRTAMTNTFDRLKEAARIRKFLTPSAPAPQTSGRTVLPRR